MLALIEITLNVFVLGGIAIVAGLIGFVGKSAMINRSKQAVDRLEKEMLISHAEILRLQKELAGKEVQPSQAPIVSIRDNTTEPVKENLPDAAMRKKLLTKTKP
jgi:hypothetical protein